MTIIFLIFIAIIGLIIGSFLSALIYRSNTDEPMWKSRSHCPKCKHKLSWPDLIPLASFLILRGKCRYCRKSISLEYPFIEILTSLVFILTSYIWLTKLGGFSSPVWFNLSSLVFYLFSATSLLALFFTDLKYGIIPDRIVIPAILVTIIYFIFVIASYSVLTYFSYKEGTLTKYFLPPHSNYYYQQIYYFVKPYLITLVGAILVSLSFYLLILATKGRGMGGGDIRLGFYITLLSGFPKVLLSLLLAVLTGAIVSVTLIIVRKKRFGETIPFGPFLALGTYVVMLWGQEIWSWYLNLIGIR